MFGYARACRALPSELLLSAGAVLLNMSSLSGSVIVKVHACIDPAPMHMVQQHICTIIHCDSITSLNFTVIRSMFCPGCGTPPGFNML